MVRNLIPKFFFKTTTLSPHVQYLINAFCSYSLKKVCDANRVEA